MHTTIPRTFPCDLLSDHFLNFLILSFFSILFDLSDFSTVPKNILKVHFSFYNKITF